MTLGQSSQGQPPFGSSPATGPTQNLGSTAGGLARIALILRIMEETLPLVGASTEPGQDLLKAMQMLAKHIQPGSVSPASERNSLQNVMLKMQQNAPMMAALKARMAQSAQAPVSAMPDTSGSPDGGVPSQPQAA